MALPSVSIASIVIGFISFSFTLAIVSHCEITIFRSFPELPSVIVLCLGFRKNGTALRSPQLLLMAIFTVSS